MPVAKCSAESWAMLFSGKQEDKRTHRQTGKQAGAGSSLHINLLHTRRLTFQRLQKRHPASSSVTFKMVSSVSDWNV